MIQLAVPVALGVIALVSGLLEQRQRLNDRIVAIALLVTCALEIVAAGAPEIVIMGRTLSITPLSAWTMVSSTLFLAIAFWAASTSDRTDNTSRGASVLTLAIIVTSLLIRSIVVSSMMLCAALFISVLVPAQKDDMSRRRIVPIAVLSTFALILLAQGLEKGESAGTLFSAQSTTIAASIAILLTSGCPPFHTWLAPTLRRGQAVQTIILAGILPFASLALITLWQLDTQIVLSTASRMTVMIIGTAGCLLGAILSMIKQTPRQILCGAAISDVGVIITSLALGTELGMIAALLMSMLHALALLGATVIIPQVGEPATPAQRKLFVIMIASLSGLPTTAGFSTRLLVTSSIAKASPTLVAIILLSSVIPLVSAIRWSLTSTVTISSVRRPMMLPGYAIATVLILIGCIPAVISAPVTWIIEHLSVFTS